jgi:uncharacterized protein
MRNLLFFLVILAVVYYLRRLLAGENGGGRGGAASSGQQAPEREAEQVLPCAHCGLLVPASEGVQAQGLFFCSPEHSSLGPARQ